MGVMTTKEQIRNAQGPSLKLPLRANPFETAGRTLGKQKWWDENGNEGGKRGFDFLEVQHTPQPFQLTNNIVDEPVIAKTVQISTISRYHFAVQRSGIGLGPENDFQNFRIWEYDDVKVGFDIASFVADFATSFLLLIFPFWEFIFPYDRRRRPMIFCLVIALYSIADVLGCW